MTKDAPALPLTVALTPPLFAIVDTAPRSVRRQIVAELSELLRDLGVSRRPDVNFQERDRQPWAPVIRLFVDGRPCLFPAVTIAEALAYVDGTPQVALDTAAVVDRLQGLNAPSSDQMAELIATVCRAAISAQPGILGTPADDAAGHAALSLGMAMSGLDQGAHTPVADSGDPAEQHVAALATKTINILVDPVYLRTLTGRGQADELFRSAREDLFTEIGLPLPPFHLCPDPSLRPAAFAFRVNAVRTLPRIGLPPGMILVSDTAERLALNNIYAEPTLNPATRQPGAITNQEHKDALDAQGLTTWDAIEFLILNLASTVRRSAYALMTRDVAASMTQQLEVAFPALGEAALRHVPPDALAPVLRELLIDGISVRNLRRILEFLLRHETVSAPSQPRDIVAFVRSGLADAIAHNSAQDATSVLVYLLAPELEHAVVAHRDSSEPTDGEESLPERLSAAVTAELSHLPSTAQVPALLTRDDLRQPLRELLRYEFPQLTFLAYGDLPPNYSVQPVARISWA